MKAVGSCSSSVHMKCSAALMGSNSSALKNPSIPASRNGGNLSDQQMHADSMGAGVLMAPLTNLAALSI